MKLIGDARRMLHDRSCVPVAPFSSPFPTLPHFSPAALALLAFAACGDDATAVKLVLTPDAQVSSAPEVAAAVNTLEVVVDAADGLHGVSAAGPTPGGGTALDWDQDGVLEVAFVSTQEEDGVLPVLEVGLSQNAGRDLQFTVLGYDGAAAHDARAAAALGMVTARCTTGEVRSVGTPFNLRASARPPRVIMALPADGTGNVPLNLPYVTLFFSTQVRADSLTDEVALRGDAMGDVTTTLTLIDAVFAEAGGVMATRSVLQIAGALNPLGDNYTLTVGTGVTSEQGLGFDQLADQPGAEAFVIHFSAPASVGGPPPSGCADCPPGYGCLNGVDGCLPIPSCDGGCGAGFVCDNASATCVDDCRLFGSCPTAGTTCEPDTGLCS